MRRRTIKRFRPAVERFETKRLLSAGSPALHLAKGTAGSDAVADHKSAVSNALAGHTEIPRNHVRSTSSRSPLASADPGKPVVPRSFLAFRVTQKPYKLVPPFQQFLVQTRQPVPGQVYNVNYIALKNGTAQTFDASSGFTVRLTNQRGNLGFPILTGTEQWKPGQVIVFYVLTKKYYPVSFVAGGYQFDLGGRSSTLAPGPSGIFLRLTYNPATFARTLDWIVAYGQGAQLGLGPKFGLPDTAINEFVAARTQRRDFGGHF
jgi:hypothetical protein